MKDSTNATPAASNKPTPKSSKPSKKVVLHLPTAVLAQFPSAQPPRKAARSKPSAAPTPIPPVNVDESTFADNASESNATPIPKNESEGTPTANDNDTKGKNTSSSKSDKKRSEPSDDANANAKARGKPGPKPTKRRRIDIDKDAANKTPWTLLPTTANHKAGPKANQGAINAGLRALDRTGKSCRKWNKNGFQLKSFTGVQWSSPGAWKTPQASTSFNGDVKSETTGSTEEKAGQSSSVLPSERSNNGGEATTQIAPADVASSPAPTQVADGVAAA
ncbi:MAG: hypothetical protein M1828_004819 [Chrysothrix sp. TS-e1954]|nr:MAG: hypothetical protein M1828_004819 [Chrysothrix sp. TS-e1954]